jgi:hypothetical protein
MRDYGSPEEHFVLTNEPFKFYTLNSLFSALNRTPLTYKQGHALE